MGMLDPDHCYECHMDENDYYFTDNGEKVYWCDTCPFNQSDEETKQEETRNWMPKPISPKEVNNG